MVVPVAAAGVVVPAGSRARFVFQRLEEGGRAIAAEALLNKLVGLSGREPHSVAGSVSTEGGAEVDSLQ